MALRAYDHSGAEAESLLPPRPLILASLIALIALVATTAAATIIRSGSLIVIFRNSEEPAERRIVEERIIAHATTRTGPDVFDVEIVTTLGATFSTTGAKLRVP